MSLKKIDVSRLLHSLSSSSDMQIAETENYLVQYRSLHIYIVPLCFVCELQNARRQIHKDFRSDLFFAIGWMALLKIYLRHQDCLEFSLTNGSSVISFCAHWPSCTATRIAMPSFLWVTSNIKNSA